jgi:hypothetical protein
VTITITDQNEIEQGDTVSLVLGETSATGRALVVDAETDIEGRCVRGVSIPGIGWAYLRPDVVVQQEGVWRFVSATREVSEYKTGHAGTATVMGTPGVRVMRVQPDDRADRVMPWISDRTIGGWFAHTEAEVTDFVPDEVPRLLPTREQVAAAIQGDNRVSVRNFMISHGVREDEVLVDPAVFCVHPLDAAIGVLALLTDKSDQHGDKCGNPSCDC